MMSLLSHSSSPCVLKKQLMKDISPYKGIRLADIHHNCDLGSYYINDKDDQDLRAVTRRIVKDLKAGVRPTHNIFDFGQVGSNDLYPFPVLDLEFSVGRCRPRISVIIPCYNNVEHLYKTLTHLLRASLFISSEVIVVDDGSTDLDAFQLEEWINRNIHKNIQVKYIFYPRSAPRKMGDQLFRAGIARNLGVLHSEAEVLSFMDSDVIVSENYLDSVLKKIDSQKILQTRRYDLDRNSSVNPRYSELNLNNCILDDTYWVSFNSLKKPWNSLEHVWKYTCSHSLSITKEDFYDLGWFRPQYNFYGFEDTDLGYRAHLKKFKFELHDEPSFHLYHRPERSEYKQNADLRQLLLKKSCRRFLQYNPHPEVLDVFSFYLN